MKTVGQILQAERIRQQKSLIEIYKTTKIPLAALKKIEADQFDHLPPATFTKGFLCNYAKSLGLDPQKILATFRRDYIETKKGTILPKDFSQDVSSRGIGFNPRTFSLLSLSTVAAVILIYLFFQLRTILFPPKIKVEEVPPTVTSSELTIKGRVSREAVVTVNGNLVLTENKRFSYPLKLLPGDNQIEIKAVDRRKKESTIVLEVRLDI